jgi:hypothetical protein
MNPTANGACSFCHKHYRDVGPLVEGPGNIYICAECVDLIQNIIDQEKIRRSGGDHLSYLHLKAAQVIRHIEEAGILSDSCMRVLSMKREREDVDPSIVPLVINLCAATGLLTVIADIVQSLKTKDLIPLESALLDEIQTKVEHLSRDLGARADRATSDYSPT